jgi:hypothetical protein
MKQEKIKIKKGSIVRFEEGNYRVTSLRGGKVNLGSIFGSRIYHKGIPVEYVVEYGAEFYESCSKSETYMCM